MPRVFISTVEVSADRHASHLARALREQVEGIVIDAAGGDRLAAAGANLAVDMRGRAVMGLRETISQLMFYNRATTAILKHLQAHRHDALVLVDGSSFHLRLARKAKRLLPDLPIIYYIAPKLWAWKEWRVKNLRRDIDRTLCIFPFEVKFFGDRGVDAVFVGNPTLDQIRRVDGKDMTRILRVEEVRRHSDPANGVLAVFPGSRKSEVKYLWPIMAKTVELLRPRFPGLKVAVALAPDWTCERLAAFAPLPGDISYIRGESQELLDAASVVLAKSGTTTLEAALLGKPMVVTYAADRASWYLVSKFVKLPYVSLPNIIAGKTIIKELLQENATPENLAGEIAALLSNPRYYRKMRSKLLALRDSLGTEAAADRAAREVAGFLPPGAAAADCG